MKSRQRKTYDRISRRAYKLMEEAGLTDIPLRPSEEISEAEERYWRQNKAINRANEYRAQARKLLPAMLKHELDALLIVKRYGLPTRIVQHYRQNWRTYPVETKKPGH
jgi:hypothetical protein